MQSKLFSCQKMLGGNQYYFDQAECPLNNYKSTISSTNPPIIPSPAWTEDHTRILGSQLRWTIQKAYFLVKKSSFLTNTNTSILTTESANRACLETFTIVNKLARRTVAY